MSTQPKGQCEAVVRPRKEVKGKRIGVKRNRWGENHEIQVLVVWASQCRGTGMAGGQT